MLDTIMCMKDTKGGGNMTDKQLSSAMSEQQEIADILGYLKSKGYEFTEREKGRIEQMLIDGKVAQNTSAVT